MRKDHYMAVPDLHQHRDAPDGMPFAEIPNDQVVEAARQFRETADFLHAHLREHNCVAPLQMIAAFGIELFLKSMNSKCVYHQDDMLAESGSYRVTAETKKGHNLVPLLDAIDRHFRKGLDDAYANKPVIPGKANLQDALAEYDVLFVDTRYQFEDGKGRSGASITGLVMLLDLIADHVDSIPRQEPYSILRCSAGKRLHKGKPTKAEHSG
jgi:hypothetical protein